MEQSLFAPVLATVLRDRKLVFAVTAAAFAQFGLAALKLPAWQCPLLQVLGIPCPGCGLTRATVVLFHGDWRGSIAFHAFAPVFLLALVLVGCTALLPHAPRRWIISGVEALERQTGITTLLLLALIVYWLARLLILQSAFVQLIRG